MSQVRILSSRPAKKRGFTIARRGRKTNRYYREKALNHYGATCRVCGYDVKEILEVHHRNGNRRNNKTWNLDVLCPTHHKEYDLGIRTYDGLPKCDIGCVKRDRRKKKNGNGNGNY